MMNRRGAIGVIALAGLAGCAGGSEPQLAADGRSLPQVYRVGPSDEAAISFRMLDSINTLRSAKGVQPLAFNAALNAAALTHSRDMSVQNRPWHFGSDASSPLSRVQRVGYSGQLLGETISETYQTELETLSAWMAQPDTRAVIMDPRGREIGFSWFQTENGKLWWTLMIGG
jgi:uncharacterized protein YkwD